LVGAKTCQYKSRVTAEDGSAHLGDENEDDAKGTFEHELKLPKDVAGCWEEPEGEREKLEAMEEEQASREEEVDCVT
jgi:hypothetical protein